MAHGNTRPMRVGSLILAHGGPLLGWLADATGGRAPLILGGVVCLMAGTFGCYASRRHLPTPGGNEVAQRCSELADRQSVALAPRRSISGRRLVTREVEIARSSQAEQLTRLVPIMRVMGSGASVVLGRLAGGFRRYSRPARPTDHLSVICPLGQPHFRHSGNIGVPRTPETAAKNQRARGPRW